MKIEFAQPRFTGPRFDEHTLPVDVARDLAAYETLVLELAKHLYLRDHPERQRVPKGFASSFRLDIERIDEGSAKPLLALVVAGMLQLNGGEQDYFERSRDLIANCVAAPEAALPEDFPKELLVHFNQFGRSLREGEALELPLRGRDASARLTPEKRKQLVLAADQFYEREIALIGHIEEVDYGKSSFRLRLVDGGQATIAMPETFLNTARSYGGRARHQIGVKGIGSYDSWDRLQRIVSVESLELIKNFALSARLDEIAQVRDGWFEGAGVAPNPASLTLVTEKLVSEYPDRLPLPILAPTQDGNMLLEWNADGDPSLDINLQSLRASFHAFGRNEEDIERDFNLENWADWQSLLNFLGENIRLRNA